VAPIVAKAASDAGREPPEICARIFVAPTTDRETVLTMGKFAIAAYLTVPVYAAFHEWLGRGDQLAGLWAKWAEGDRKGALAEIPDELVDQLIVHGSPDECHEHLQRYVANGVTTVALAPLPFGYDIGQAVRDLAPR
jgi:alkanesulfonate monooxygenase SsuD/methylene tetrahydromethanopterin reductase-like flavin-dependent oxidoreductase (luciferase family)